jgi:hypothetical protein
MAKADEARAAILPHGGGSLALGREMGVANGRACSVRECARATFGHNRPAYRTVAGVIHYGDFKQAMVLGEDALMTIASLFKYTLLAFFLVVPLLVKDDRTAASYVGSERS